MLYSKEATGTIDEVSQKIQEAAIAHRFKVLHVNNLTAQMQSQEILFPLECRVIEISDPTLAANCLTGDKTWFTLLPLRIMLSGEAEKVVVSATMQGPLIQDAGKSELREQAEAADFAVRNIIDEVCGKRSGMDVKLAWNMF